MSFRHERRFYEAVLTGFGRDYSPSSCWCFSRRGGMIDEYIVEHGEYMGAGSGAFSYLDGVTYARSFSINRYVNCIERKKTVITATRVFDRRERQRYDFLVGLFGLRLDKKAMQDKYGKRFFRNMWKELVFFHSAGALRDEGTHYTLTQKGMYSWVVMMREFFMGVNNFRDEMRANVRMEREADRSEFEAVGSG